MLKMVIYSKLAILMWKQVHVTASRSKNKWIKSILDELILRKCLNLASLTKGWFSRRVDIDKMPKQGRDEQADHVQHKRAGHRRASRGQHWIDLRVRLRKDRLSKRTWTNSKFNLKAKKSFKLLQNIQNEESPYCNERGKVVCGICECDALYYGNKCECSKLDSQTDSNKGSSGNISSCIE